MFLNALLLYTHPTPQHTILHVILDAQKFCMAIGRKIGCARALSLSSQNTCTYAFILNTEHVLQYTVL